MQGESFSDDDLKAVAAAYEANGQNKAAAARSLNNMAKTSFRRRLYAAAERGLLGFKPVLPGFVINKTSTTTDGSGNVTAQTVSQINSPDEGEGVVFEMPKGKVLGKGTYHITPEGILKQAWIRTKDDENRFLVEAIKEVFKDEIAPVPLIHPPHLTDVDLLSVYPIADQHNGLLAWGKETGEPYDLEIGKQRLMACASRMVSQAPHSRQAIVLNLGDWQHTDDSTNLTPGHKNKLDVDSRYRKILVAGVQLMKNIVDLALQKHHDVLVVNIPGNHDPHSSIALDVALIEAYANNPRVKVWGSPSEFFFHRFGNTLIGATHGYRCKPQDMAMAMAVRAREDWGSTAYHYFYFGHIHHESVKEIGDVRVESFQTLAANDAHHEASGYTSGKSLSSITIHREEGEIGRLRINIPSAARKATEFKEAA